MAFFDQVITYFVKYDFVIFLAKFRVLNICCNGVILKYSKPLKALPFFFLKI
jgi:hypothetical protein